MGMRVSVNGREVKDVLVYVDAANNIATVEEIIGDKGKINLRDTFVEVNIYGDVDILV